MITALAQPGSALPVSTYLNEANRRQIGIRHCECLADEFRRAESVFGAHANAVHRGGVIMGRGNFRKDGLRSNAIEPIVDGNFFDG